MPTERDILQLISEIPSRLDGDLSLEALAARAGWSRFHFHRAFRAVTGETPKQYTLRLRLERAAAALLTSPDPVTRVASAAGFASHEVFTRAFRRHFGCTPVDYRARGRRELPPSARLQHAAAVTAAGPCVGLFHLPLDPPRRYAMPMLSIERRELAAQPILFVRKRIARADIGRSIGEASGAIFTYAHQSGVALDGHPLTRYTEMGPGLMTIDIGFKVAVPAPASGEIQAGELQAGPAVVAMHGGSYETLHETFVAVERWVGEHGLQPAGAPWDYYVTDPAEHPDPADWRTEVYWPVSAKS